MSRSHLTASRDRRAVSGLSQLECHWGRKLHGLAVPVTPALRNLGPELRTNVRSAKAVPEPLAGLTLGFAPQIAILSRRIRWPRGWHQHAPRRSGRRCGALRFQKLLAPDASPLSAVRPAWRSSFQTMPDTTPRVCRSASAPRTLRRPENSSTSHCRGAPELGRTCCRAHAPRLGSLRRSCARFISLACSPAHWLPLPCGRSMSTWPPPNGIDLRNRRC